MGTRLPKRLAIERSKLTTITTVKDLVLWLKSFLRELDTYILKSYSQAEFGETSFSNWSIREATPLDVTDGKATVAGNLIITHNTTGTKYEFPKA